MGIRFFKAILMSMALVLPGCASFYHQIDLSSQYYSFHQKLEDGLEVSYSYDIYYSSGNTKYSKKEKEYNYRTLAVRITNNSDLPLILTEENFRIYKEEEQIFTVDQDTYLNDVRQPTGIFLLYSVAGPWNVQSFEDINGVKTYEIGYFPLGFAFGLANTGVAIHSNAKHRENIRSASIYHKIIDPDTSIEGILCLDFRGYGYLTFRYNRGTEGL